MTTLDIQGPTTPERLLDTIRRQAPHLLKEVPAAEAPEPPAVKAPASKAPGRGALSGAEPLLTPQEVATMFRVDPKTVTRWAKGGKLASIRTLGGHRRYLETEVRDLLGFQAS